jgi:hypothetical protein
MALPGLILDVDLAKVPDALLEAKRLRAAGEPFIARIPFAHPRTTFAYRNAAELLARTADYDERRRLFDAFADGALEIGGKPQAEVEALDPGLIAMLREIAGLSNGLAVNSWHDHDRQEYILGVTVEPHFLTPREDVPVPAFERDADADAVVVWGPTLAARSLALHAFALEEVRRPAYVVCREGRIDGLQAQWLQRERAAEALRRAAVIVDATIHHPGNALALARLRLPLAASIASNAHESLEEIAVYLPWSRSDLLRSVQIALGLGPPRVRPGERDRCEILVVQSRSASAALAGAVESARSGKTFDAAVQLPERRASLAADAAVPMLSDCTDQAERGRRLESIAHQEFDVGGIPARRAHATGAQQLGAVRDAADLAERVVTRSWLEAFRLVNAFAQYPTALSVQTRPDPRVPPPAPREPDGSIVVWAPQTPPQRLALMTGALDAEEPLVFVLSVEHAADALRRAAVVVVADADDPQPALALAAWEIPLCVANTSGAHEYLENVERFRPWHARSIADAVRRARGGPIPRARRSVLAPAAEIGALDAGQRDVELVSLVVRRDEHANGSGRMLPSIERQTYPRIEILSADDDVRDLNRALKESRGAFIGLVDERDVLLPDHVTRLVAALDASRGGIAYSTTFAAFYDDHASTADARAYRGIGREPVERSALLAKDQFPDGGLRVLMRRSVLEEAGWLDESIPRGYEYELWLRLSRTHDFVCVDRITTIFSQVPNRTHTPDLAAQSLIYALHPAAGRAAIEAQRRELLDHLMRGHGALLASPALPR